MENTFDVDCGGAGSGTPKIDRIKRNGGKDLIRYTIYKYHYKKGGFDGQK
jgi:hypothetical protein